MARIEVDFEEPILEPMDVVKEVLPQVQEASVETSDPGKGPSGGRDRGQDGRRNRGCKRKAEITQEDSPVPTTRAQGSHRWSQETRSDRRPCPPQRSQHDRNPQPPLHILHPRHKRTYLCDKRRNPPRSSSSYVDVTNHTPAHPRPNPTTPSCELASRASKRHQGTPAQRNRIGWRRRAKQAREASTKQAPVPVNAEAILATAETTKATAAVVGHAVEPPVHITPEPTAIDDPIVVDAPATSADHFVPIEGILPDGYELGNDEATVEATVEASVPDEYQSLQGDLQYNYLMEDALGQYNSEEEIWIY